MTCFKKILFFKLLSALTVAVSSLGASAEPYFIHKDGTTVYDQATGLLWMRCSLGQKWDGKTCMDDARKLTFEAAQTSAKMQGILGGFSDWEIPTARQLQSLRYCENGFRTSLRDNTSEMGDGGERVLSTCNAGVRVPTLNTIVFPNTGVNAFYWTSSTYVPDDVRREYYIQIVFGSAFANRVGGYIDSAPVKDRNQFQNYVRLVQKTPLMINEVPDGFMSLDAYLSNIRSRQEAAELAARQRQEAADKVERQREESDWRKLVASGAQNMYLQAAKEQKSGSDSKAEKIYEAIMEKHPASPFAVKASDQLTAMGRSERQASATRAAADASERAANAQRDSDRNSSNRAACFSQVRSCEARCSDSSNRGVCIQMRQRTCN